MLSVCILEVGRVSEFCQETVHSTLKTESRDDLVMGRAGLRQQTKDGGVKEEPAESCSCGMRT